MNNPGFPGTILPLKIIQTWLCGNSNVEHMTNRGWIKQNRGVSPEMRRNHQQTMEMLPQDDVWLGYPMTGFPLSWTVHRFMTETTPTVTVYARLYLYWARWATPFSKASSASWAQYHLRCWHQWRWASNSALCPGPQWAPVFFWGLFFNCCPPNSFSWSSSSCSSGHSPHLSSSSDSHPSIALGCKAFLMLKLPQTLCQDGRQRFRSRCLIEVPLVPRCGSMLGLASKCNDLLVIKRGSGRSPTINGGVVEEWFTNEGFSISSSDHQRLALASPKNNTPMQPIPNTEPSKADSQTWWEDSQM